MCLNLPRARGERRRETCAYQRARTTVIAAPRTYRTRPGPGQGGDDEVGDGQGVLLVRGWFLAALTSLTRGVGGG
ncbi:hypothetical protein GCM10022245_51290 [Streptomyces mayteni]